MPSQYREDSCDDPYDASMRNLRKACARQKELRAYPRPWRSKEEGRMVRRFVWWWLTSRDSNKPSGRAWAKQLGISHTWLQKLVREFTADPSKVRRLQAYGDPTTAQLSRAREYTHQMRERGELRVSRRAKWEKFFERYPEARGIYHSSGKFVNRLRGRRSAQTSHNPVCGPCDSFPCTLHERIKNSCTEFPGRNP